MKGLKEFLELLKEDKGLMAEVEKVKDDTAKIVEIAKEHGFEFTEDEFNDAKMNAVAGGGEAADIIGALANVGLQGANMYFGYKQAQYQGQQAQTWVQGKDANGNYFGIDTTTGRAYQWDGQQWV